MRTDGILVFVSMFALLGVTLFNDWGAEFYVNALIAGTVAVGVFVTMVACSVLTMVFTALTLGHATTSTRRDG